MAGIFNSPIKNVQTWRPWSNTFGLTFQLSLCMVFSKVQWIPRTQRFQKITIDLFPPSLQEAAFKILLIAWHFFFQLLHILWLLYDIITLIFYWQCFLLSIHIVSMLLYFHFLLHGCASDYGFLWITPESGQTSSHVSSASADFFCLLQAAVSPICFNPHGHAPLCCTFTQDMW